MKNFKQLIKELPSNRVVAAFGQFQPPTAGHELLVKTVQTLAGSNDHVIYASTNEDKKHPLPADRKVYFLKRMFSEANIQPAGFETISEAAYELSKKYKHLTVVTFADKVSEFESQLKENNGKLYNFETIKVVSAGDVDPDSNTVSAVSGNAMCESAKKGNFTQFKKGVPHTLTELDSRRLMNDVRKGMGLEPIRETINLVKDEIREQYFRGEIFNVGEIVESAGEQFEIVKRGSNHLLVKSQDGSLVSKFINDVSEAVKDVTAAKVEKKSKEMAKKAGSAEKEVEIAKPEEGKPMSVLPKKKEDPKKNQSDFSEAHKLGDKVIMTKGPADVKGKTGHVGEIRKRWTGDSKTYTIDHEGGSIQLKSTHFKKFKEHIEKVKGGYEVESEHGNKNLGKSKSLSAAKKRLKQVEYFKHMHEEHDDQYEMAQEFKKTAEQSKAAGNHGAYHAHMANHHDHVGQWHEKKGRSAAAEREYDKAAEHHEQSLKHPYISESFSSIEHNGDHKKITHGADFNIMIGREHHAKISGLEHGERHVFKCKEDNEYGCWRSNDHLHFKRHSGDSGLHSNMSVIIPVAQWNNQDAMGQDKSVSESTLVESAPFKDLKSAVHYASEKVKTHRDHLDGIEVYKHKAGGYDVNHTMNANGRNALHGSGAKHLGTVYKDKQFNIKHNIKEETINELSTDLLGKYKTAAHASAKASDQAGNYKKGDKRFSGINKATRKQFDNDLKKHGQFKEDIYSSDTKIKKVQVQDKDGNWVFKDRKFHPHKVDFKNSKMNAKPAEPVDPTKIDTETAYQDFMDKRKKQNEAWVLNPTTGKTKKKYKDIKDNKTLEISSGAGTTFDPFSNTSTK